MRWRKRASDEIEGPTWRCWKGGRDEVIVVVRIWPASIELICDRYILGNQAGQRVLVKGLLKVLVPMSGGRPSINYRRRDLIQVKDHSPLDQPLQHIDKIPDLFLPIPLVSLLSLIFVADIGISESRSPGPQNSDLAPLGLVTSPVEVRSTGLEESSTDE